jgi:hypothetical protein
LQIKTKIVRCQTADSKPVKQEVNGTVILPLLVLPGIRINREQRLEPNLFVKWQPVWKKIQILILMTLWWDNDWFFVYLLL